MAGCVRLCRLGADSGRAVGYSYQSSVEEPDVRPAGRGELESLYFDYPHFEFRRPPEMAGQSDRHPAVVAGAGPVGMTAAIDLARRGVPCVLLAGSFSR